MRRLSLQVSDLSLTVPLRSYGWHGDFYNGWDRQVLQTAIDTCTSDSGPSLCPFLLATQLMR